MNTEILIKIVLVLIIIALGLYLINKLAVPIIAVGILGIITMILLWILPIFWSTIQWFSEFSFNLGTYPVKAMGITVQYESWMTFVFMAIFIPIMFMALSVTRGRSTFAL